MDTAELKEQIAKLVVENELKKALTLILDNAIHHADEAVKLLARLNDMEDNQLKGTIKAEDAVVEKNQIRDAIMELKNILDEIPIPSAPATPDQTNKTDSDSENKSEVPPVFAAPQSTNKYFKYGLLIFISILLLAVLFFLNKGGKNFEVIVSGVLVLGLCVVFLQIQNNEFRKEQLLIESTRLQNAVAA